MVSDPPPARSSSAPDASDGRRDGSAGAAPAGLSALVRSAAGVLGASAGMAVGLTRAGGLTLARFATAAAPPLLRPGGPAAAGAGRLGNGGGGDDAPNGVGTDHGDGAEHRDTGLLDLAAGEVQLVAEEGVDLVQDSLGLHRRVWEESEEDGTHHAQIEVRALRSEGDDARRLRRGVAAAVEGVRGVRWAEVNAITGRVAVAFDPAVTPLGALTSAIEAVEKAHRVGGRRRGDGDEPSWDVRDRADHPSDVEPIHRSVAAVAGDVAALAFSVVGTAGRLPRLPIEVAALVSAADHNLAVRRRLERLVGRRAVDLLLPLGGAAANGVAQGTLGIVVDLGLQLSTLGELRARQQVWCRREREFYSAHDHTIEPPAIEPRPVPFPDGPIEVWSERLAAASVAGFGVGLLTTRELRRAADAFLTGTAKACRAGRESFAAQFGRALAGRGVVPLDGSALRRLDRIDTVVVDGRDLLADRWRLEGVACADLESDLDEEAVETALRSLFAPDDPFECRTDGPWELRPCRRPPAELRPHADRLRRPGARLLVARHDGRPVAVAVILAELDPGAPALLAAVREAGHHLVIADRDGELAGRIDADAVIPRGKPMGAAVRKLQREGAAVAVIARRGKRGLAAADVGIGIARSSGRPPWGADLVCGPHLVEAALIIDATRVARTVSRRSAALAVAGSAGGAAMTLLGPARGAANRGLMVVNTAAAAALVAGTWEARRLARTPRPAAVDNTPWHALSVDAVLRRVEGGRDGLRSDEASRRRAGEREGTPRSSTFDHVLDELANPLNPVLAAGAAASAAVGSAIDAALVGGVIALNTAVGTVQRTISDRAVAGLARSTDIEATVIRDGTRRTVSERDLVPGDVVELEAGEPVPADCRLLDADGLEVDESSLTGESLPVLKEVAATPGAPVAERTGMVFDGTSVAAGRGTAVVVATGRATEAGRSLDLAAGAPTRAGVEERLAALSRRVVPAVGAAGAGMAVAGLVRRWPARNVLEAGIGLTTAAVPEGLPFIASASELAAAHRLRQRGAVVRNPRTIEALGRVDVLCFDKTGTLTEGRIALRQVSDGEEAEPVDRLGGPGRRVLAAALRATPNGDGPADTTDEAIREGAEAAGVDPGDDVGGWEVVEELPFESSRGLLATLGRAEGGQYLCVKGAPETVLPLCDRWDRGDGGIVPLDDAARDRLEATAEALAEQGLRVLAVAQRSASSRTDLDDDRVDRLDAVGFVALADPIRSTAAEAVAGVRAAGVRAVMITGDHPSTARAIGLELGIVNGHRVVTGSELDELDDDALDDVVEQVAVVARVTPAQKVRIVQALQRRGRVVAMTGDGANDAAAIRLADVGVALGGNGVAAARDAADVVVVDDRIETLIDAISEGRALWASVREAIAVLLGGNLGEVGYTVAASLFSARAPLNTRQFLLVNLLTDLAPAIAIATRPPGDRSTEVLLREGPEASLGAALTKQVAVRATATTAGALAAYGAASLTGTPSRAATVGLIGLVGSQMGQTLIAGHGRSPVVAATAFGSLAVLAATVQTPGVSQFFGCRPVGPLGWAQGLGAAALATAGAFAADKVTAGNGAGSPRSAAGEELVDGGEVVDEGTGAGDEGVDVGPGEELSVLGVDGQWG